MKTKSLFISTIAMVVLLVVALATGTFAWYQSSLTATVSDATVSAAASTSASLTLDWTDNAGAASPTLSFGQGADIAPMIPTLALADYAIAPATPAGAAPVFHTALMGTLDGTNYTFKTNGGAVTPWTQIADDEESTQLQISNVGAATATVTATVAITPGAGELPSNDDILRVAIYVEAPNGIYNLIGVWASADYPIYFGSIVSGNNVTSITTANDGLNVISPTAGASESFTLIAGGSAKIHVKAWLEGTILDQSRSLDTNYSDPTFTITFNATEA